jgi:mannose-6-phosphate isomerase-like protein (cupin superfamily)
MHVRHRDTRPRLARDGSQIRELVSADRDGSLRQSLAEVTVLPGVETLLLKHLRSEKLCHVLSGQGWVTLDDETLEIHAGDTLLIAPGTLHAFRNPHGVPLVMLCSFAPPYSDEDTFVLTGDDGIASA